MCIYRFYYFIKILTESDKSLFKSLSYRWKSLQLIQVFLSSTENNKGTYWRGAGTIIYTTVSSSQSKYLQYTVCNVHCGCDTSLLEVTRHMLPDRRAKFVSRWMVMNGRAEAHPCIRFMSSVHTLSSWPRSCSAATPTSIPQTPHFSPQATPPSLPHCLSPSLLTTGSINSVRFVLTPWGYSYCRVPVCVCVHVECDARVESLWRVERREEGLQKKINTWIPREKIHPCYWSYFTQDKEGAEKKG